MITISECIERMQHTIQTRDCKHICLLCKYYDTCKAETESTRKGAKKVKKKRENEKQRSKYAKSVRERLIGRMADHEPSQEALRRFRKQAYKSADVSKYLKKRETKEEERV